MAPRAPSPTPSANSDNNPRAKTSPSKAAKPESEVEDSEGQSGAEGDDGDEEVYEIEAILAAKKGHFEHNKTGYLVKWKGYAKSHNSWVNEDDATGAHELIREFEEKQKKKKLQQSAKNSQSPAKRPRKSMDADSEDGEASVSAPKKRSRKSVSEKPTNEDDDDERPVKKARKTTDKKVAPITDPLPDDDEDIGNMAQHMQAPTWDQLIKHIDTVERVDKKLYVYFTLQDGQRIREDSKICADKFPKMLIEFYESNLRWKEADNH